MNASENSCCNLIAGIAVVGLIGMGIAAIGFSATIPVLVGGGIAAAWAAINTFGELLLNSCGVEANSLLGRVAELGLLVGSAALVAAALPFIGVSIGLSTTAFFFTALFVLGIGIGALNHACPEANQEDLREQDALRRADQAIH